MDTAKFLREHSTVVRHRNRDLVSLGHAARRSYVGRANAKRNVRLNEAKREFDAARAHLFTPKATRPPGELGRAEQF